MLSDSRDSILVAVSPGHRSGEHQLTVWRELSHKAWPRPTFLVPDDFQPSLPLTHVGRRAHVHPPAPWLCPSRVDSVLCLMCTWGSHWAGGLRKVGNWVTSAQQGGRGRAVRSPSPLWPSAVSRSKERETEAGSGHALLPCFSSNLSGGPLFLPLPRLQTSCQSPKGMPRLPFRLRSPARQPHPWVSISPVQGSWSSGFLKPQIPPALLSGKARDPEHPWGQTCQGPRLLLDGFQELVETRAVPLGREEGKPESH